MDSGRPFTTLDLARRTGVAWGLPGELPNLEAWDLGTGERGARFLRLMKFLVRHLDTVKPQKVFVEEVMKPHVGDDIGSSIHVLKSLYGYAAIAEVTCEGRNIPVEFLDRQEVLRHFCGAPSFKRIPVLDAQGRQKKDRKGKLVTESGAKLAVLTRCKQIGLKVGNDDNMADAAAMHDFAAMRDCPRAVILKNSQRPARLVSRPGR